jgi:hypothetical protein
MAAAEAAKSQYDRAARVQAAMALEEASKKDADAFAARGPFATLVQATANGGASPGA